MAQWQKGDEVWAARFGFRGELEVGVVKVAAVGPKQVRLEKFHEQMNYRTIIGQEEGARTRREALLALKAAAASAVDGAKSVVLTAEANLANVETALAALEES